MDINFGNLGACTPMQILNLNYAINNMAIIDVYGTSCKYCKDDLKYSYSVDNVCWSCYMTFMEALEATEGLNTDFFLRMKVPGPITQVVETDPITGEETPTTDYTTQLDTEFQLSSCGTSNSNTYNPYANLTGALTLQTQLNEMVACMFGIPVYYFKLSPNFGSKDITFKEYALYDVESVKQIKIVVADGTMPSSKPEFSDFGLEWQSDWEVEISKGMFATAFGNNVQPTEGDLVYIPMMKRMWMVNEAYEEKNGNLMWNATTFKVALVKYQEKSSVDLGDAQAMVDSFVKNKYEDLFGDEETIDSGVEAASAPVYTPNNTYPVYESDATRKYMTSAGIDFSNSNLYYRGTMISDSCYRFTNTSLNIQIVYQRKFCGYNGVISFIITPRTADYEGNLIKCSNIDINIKQAKNQCILTVMNCPEATIRLKSGFTYFVWLRWSKELNVMEFSAAQYTYPENIPLYKLQPQHFVFDIDNPITKVNKYNIEIAQSEKKDVILHGFEGTITNIKVFDVYNDSISEILQMFPNHQHLIINDTARKVLDMHGVSMQ